MDFPRLRRRVPIARMRLPLALLFLAANLPTSVLGAQSPPSGTTLPVRLLRSLNSDKDGPGKTFEVKTTQAIPLSGNQMIRKGTRIMGHIVSTQASDPSNRVPQLTVKFDNLVYSSDKQAPILVGLRAMASTVEVLDTGTPTNAADNSADWTTRQIGGDVVYGRGGPVTTSWGEVVGKPVNDGVMVRLLAPRDAVLTRGLHCRSSETPQALGLFASTACGVYGFSHITIEHDGFEEPKGQISLVSSSKSVKIGAGSQFLLQVVDQ